MASVATTTGNSGGRLRDVVSATIHRLMIALLIALSPALSAAEQSSEPAADEAVEGPPERESPWLFMPLISSNPKFGTSIGAMAGYLHKFDKKSPISNFGLTGKYSDTKSYNVALFANTFFDEDKQRIMGVALYGKIENDYQDFLGTGVSAATTDNVYMGFGRYLYRIAGNWFIGAQGVMTNYSASTGNAQGDSVLDYLGLAGFKSNALGFAALYDSRDNTRSASTGSQLQLGNFAYREALGGDESFDVIRLEYDVYRPWIRNQVTAIQLEGRWTFDAPNSAYSSVRLPGYTQGEYLAEYMSSVLLDQRITFSRRWGMSVSTGVACLYGDNVFGNSQQCFERDSLYPMIATGAIFTLKPEAKLVARAEISVGKSDNLAFILRFGQPF